jgi:hypothetical protein
MNNFTYNDLEWKNHQDFFKNLYDSLPKIQEVAEKCLNETEYLNKYYSMLNIFRIPLKPYIEEKNYIIITKILNDVQNFLFSKNYIIAVQNKNDLNNEKKYELSEKQRLAYNKLNECFEIVVSDLSKVDIMPKVIKRNTVNPANAVKGVYQ